MKTLLTKNEQAIADILKQAETGKEKLNKFIQRAEKVCKNNFTDQEKELLRTQGGKFLIEWARAKYKFPEADDKFNQQAIGIDVNGLIAEHAKESKYWLSYNYKKDESGGYILNGKPEQAKRYYKYIESEKQAKAYKIANQLSDLLNESSELGFVGNHDLTKLTLFGDILNITQSSTTAKPKVIPNKDRIARIN
ncbi:hypothetical protein [Bizionia paragorgiae]|uniref:hypothetical protein n=1 Tax=Bizionia paragorgiae TaxID=283786 RepID=UPI003A8EFD2D